MAPLFTVETARLRLTWSGPAPRAPDAGADGLTVRPLTPAPVRLAVGTGAVLVESASGADGGPVRLAAGADGAEIDRQSGAGVWLEEGDGVPGPGREPGRVAGGAGTSKTPS